MGGSPTVVQQEPPVQAPQYNESMADVLNAQINLAPQLFAAEANPLYGQTAYANLQNQVNDILLSGQFKQFSQYYPKLAGIETDYQTKLRQGELKQISSPELGLGAYQQAFNSLTPGYQEAVAGMGNLARTATEQSLNRPSYTAYEQQVGGPSYGQYIGQVGGPSADLTLGGMQAYKFGGPGGTPYQVGQEFLQAPSYEVGQELMQNQPYQVGQELTQNQPYQVGEGLMQNRPYQVGQKFLSQPSYQTGLYTGKVGGLQAQSQLGQINTGIVGSYMNQMPGVSAIAQQLSDQAQQDLAAGRSLTPEEARLATQSAREAYAARGTALGPQAIGAEILSRAELGNQRYRERQAAAAQAAGTISNLYTPALQQAYQRQAGAEAYNLGAQGQQFGQAISQEELARAAQAQQFGQLSEQEQALAQAQGQQFAQTSAVEQALAQAQGQQFAQTSTIEQALAQAQGQQFAQTSAVEQALAQAQSQRFGQLGAKEQALAGAQGQQFGQAMTQEDILKQSQAQEYGQRLGLQELGINLQGQQYQQAMGKEGLAQQTQNQALQQALQRTQQGIAGQQAMLGLQAQQAQIGAAAMNSLQGAQAPILQAFYRQPILAGGMGQAQQFALGGQQAAGPALFNPESQTAMGSIYGAYNAKMQYASGAAQANASASAGKSAMTGQIAGAAASAAGFAAMCWIARACFGTKTNRWKKFRSNMIKHGSFKFIEWYLKNGKSIAEKIQDSMLAKTVGKLILLGVEFKWTH